MRSRSWLTYRVLIAVAVLMIFLPYFALTKPAYSQVQSSPTGSSFAGKYVNNDLGITLTLPDGYLGNATVLNGELSVQAAGTGHELSVEMLPRGNSSESAYTMFQAATSGAPPEGCTIEKASPVVSGMSGYSYTDTCSDQAYSAFMVDWGNNQILMIAMKSSALGFQSAKSDFDTIVNSVELRSSGPTSSYTLDTLQSIQEQITLKNSPVTINILTNSKVSEFRFDDSTRTLSFTVNGTQDSPGKTIIPIGSIVRGPYIVSFDGANYTNYFIHQDQNTGSIELFLSYHHSSHVIRITGASGVPEFSGAAIGGALSLIGILGISTRIWRRINQLLHPDL